MKLFTVGPVEMFPETLTVGGTQIPYFRNQAFSDVMLNCEQLFLKQIKAPEGTKSVFLTASGSGAMEAVVMNCLDSNDKALIINGGTFGKRFSQICDCHKIEHEDIMLEFNETLTEKHLARAYTDDCTALLVNADETSTGQLYNLPLLAEFCAQHNLLFIVDAISCFAADPLDAGALGIDALIISSQKALSLAPGMSFVFLSQRLYRERIKNKPSPTLYFDFNDYIENGARGQTPFTPAVGIVLQLQQMLHYIDEQGGIDIWIDRTAAVANDFRARIKPLPLTLPEHPLSSALTPIIFPLGIDAEAVNAILEQDYGLVLNPCGGKLKGRVSRVSHIGNLSISDNTALITALGQILA